MEVSKSFLIFVAIFKVMKLILKYMTPNGLDFFYQNVVQDATIAILGAVFISLKDLKK